MIDWQSVDLDAPYVSPTARPFQVGDRVRVRLSPECTFTPQPDSLAGMVNITTHPESLDGRIGVIRRIDDRDLPKHPYCVHFNEGYLHPPLERVLFREPFAATELELLDGAT